MNRCLVLSGVLLLSAAGCGGGGSTATPFQQLPVVVPNPIVSMTPAPQVSTPVPSSIPTLAPTAAPTATPVPLAQRVLGAAPLNSTPSILSIGRRTSQSQGVSNGLPILVEGAGSAGQWAGTIVSWVGNSAQAGQDIAETSGSIVASNGLAVNNPGFAPVNCATSNGWCGPHPSAFAFGTSSDPTAKPLGKQTLTLTYGDGTSGAITDYVYPGFALHCGQGFVFNGGAVTLAASQATSDVYADCTNTNVIFPKGGRVFSQPLQDTYGRFETVMPTLTAAPVFGSIIVNVPMASITAGIVFAVQTQDGGFAKVYFSSGAVSLTVPAGLISIEGMSLHSSGGPFAY